MSIESYIAAMPKVELGLQLEGAFPRHTLLMLADQNDKQSEKGFDKLLAALDTPDLNGLDPLIAKTITWLVYPDDLTRAVYDVGVMLSKQNVRYAEIGFNPLHFLNAGLSYEDLLAALTDATDRVQRGWQVTMRWVVNTPFEEPRRSDEIARWVVSAAARKAGVIALGLTGREDAQPAAQFERAFRNAIKREVPRVAQAGDLMGGAGVVDALEHLSPNRLLGGWGIADNPEVLSRLQEEAQGVVVYLTRDFRMARLDTLDAHPLQALYQAGLPVSLSAGLPEYTNTSLNAEYQAALDAGLGVDDLEHLALNAVKASFLPDEERAMMLAAFRDAYAALRAEHLAEGEATADAE